MPSTTVLRIVDPIVTLLKQGITPESIALSLACGTIIGVFPVFGTTIVLCTAAALADHAAGHGVRAVTTEFWQLPISLNGRPEPGGPRLVTHGNWRRRAAT
jgi:uncharacterized protein (DUF2062 family)